MNFVGRKNDIEVAKEVYSRLASTFEYLWKNYKRETGSHNDLKKSYMYGLKTGFSAKLREQEEESKRDAVKALPETLQEGAEGKLQLAIINEAKELNNALVTFYPRLGKGIGMNYGNVFMGSAYNAGVRDGRSINARQQEALCG